MFTIYLYRLNMYFVELCTMLDTTLLANHSMFLQVCKLNASDFGRFVARLHAVPQDAEHQLFCAAFEHPICGAQKDFKRFQSSG